MRCKRIMGMVLTLVMIIGLLPIVSESNMSKVRAESEVKAVTKSLDGITEPATGWNNYFSGAGFQFAFDSSIDNTADIKVVKASLLADDPSQWTPVILSQDDINVFINMPTSHANGGENFEINMSGSSRIQYDQTSAIIYNKNTGEVLAYGKVGDGKASSISFKVPAGMPTGSYYLDLFFDTFGEGNEPYKVHSLGQRLNFILEITTQA